MLALLSFLEANQRNRYDNANNDINSLEYQKSLYSPYGNFDGVNNDDDSANDGDWWNEYIEPSVQYYGNSRGHFNEDPRKRLTSTGTLIFTHFYDSLRFLNSIIVYSSFLEFNELLWISFDSIPGETIHGCKEKAFVEPTPRWCRCCCQGCS